MTTPGYASTTLFYRLPVKLREELAKTYHAEFGLTEGSSRVLRVLELREVEHTTMRDGDEVEVDDEAEAFWSYFVLTLEYIYPFTGETNIETQRWCLEIPTGTIDMEQWD